MNCARRKLPPNPKTNLNPNPNPNRGAIFLKGSCLVAPKPKSNPYFDLNPNPYRQGGGGGNCPDTNFLNEYNHLGEKKIKKKRFSQELNSKKGRYMFCPRLNISFSVFDLGSMLSLVTSVIGTFRNNEITD